MTRRVQYAAALFVVGASAFCAGFAASKPKEAQRIGMVIGLKPERIAEYTRLHTGENCVVRDLLHKYHMDNFSIFLQQIEGKWYEFGYYEYTGEDYEGDMSKLAAEPRNREWLKVCDAMQIPLPSEKSWAKMKSIYYNP
jgi:L-rhamnose mutarotase